MATPYRLCLLNLIRVTVRPELLWEDERQADGLRPGWADERLLLLLALLAEVQSSGGLYEPTFGQLCARMRAANWRMGEAVTSLLGRWLGGEIDVVELKIELSRALYPPSSDPLLQQPASVSMPPALTPLFSHEAEPASALFWRGGEDSPGGALGSSSPLALFARTGLLLLDTLSLASTGAVYQRCADYAAAPGDVPPELAAAAAAAASRPTLTSGRNSQAYMSNLCAALGSAGAPPAPLRSSLQSSRDRVLRGGREMANHLNEASQAVDRRGAAGGADSAITQTLREVDAIGRLGTPARPSLTPLANAGGANFAFSAASARHDSGAAEEALHALSERMGGAGLDGSPITRLLRDEGAISFAAGGMQNIMAPPPARAGAAAAAPPPGVDPRTGQRRTGTPQGVSHGMGLGVGGGGAAGGLGGATAPVLGASLALTALHIREGQVESALACLDEVVRAAQRTSDAVALSHALGLACQLLTRQAPPPPPEGPRLPPPHPASPLAAQPPPHVVTLRALLRRCAKMAETNRLPALECYAASALAQLAIRHGSVGEACASSDVAIRRTAHAAFDCALAVQTRANVPSRAAAGAERARILAGGTPYPPVYPLYSNIVAGRLVPPPTPMAATAAARAAIGCQLASAAAWSARGCAALASAPARSLLCVHSQCAHSEDVCLALAQLAGVEAATEGWAAGAAFFRRAYAWLLRWQAAEDVGMPCPFDPADLDDAHGLPCPPGLRAAATAAAHASALCRGEARVARRLVAELAALAPGRASLDPQAHLSVKLAEAATLRCEGLFGPGAETAAELADECARAGLPTLRLRALIVQASCLLDADSAGLARSLALSCIRLAARLGQDELRLEATSLWAECEAREGTHEGEAGGLVKARDELTAAQPFILFSASLPSRARALLALARAQIGCGEGGDAEGRQRLLHTLSACCEAATQADCFMVCAEAWHATALLFAADGVVDAAEQAAGRAMAMAAGEKGGDVLESFGLKD